MFFNFFKKHKWALFFSALLMNFLLANFVSAMPVGTLLYRTSSNGNLYGYNTDELVVVKNKIINNIYTGHVGIYIGQEDGVDYVVEALPSGLVKVPAKYFLNTKNGEELIGAKIPKNLSEVQRMKVVQLAKKLADSNMKYDFDFQKQKGPKSGQWICVGFTEKLYESANISNPLNLSGLEYNPLNYAINITPDGFDNYSIQNQKNGDCLSRNVEFSKISHNRETLIPLPEIIGFNSGLEYNGERYFFFPLTQFWQSSLEDVAVDINLSSEFDDKEIRGKVPEVAMIFKWSLINNPLSSVKRIASLVASVFAKEDKSEKLVFDLNSNNNSEIAENNKSNNSSSSIIGISDFLEKTNTVDTSGSNTNTGKLQSSVSIDNSQASPVLKSNNLSSNLGNIKNIELEDNILTAVKDDSRQVAVASVENFEVLRENLFISGIYATLSDDYVEIYNPNSFSVDLEEAGIRLYKTKTSATPSLMIRIGNTSDGTYPKGVIIPAKGKYIVARESASEEIKNTAHAISKRKEFTFTGDGYTIYLSGGVVSSDDDEDIIDKVGFGSATYFEIRPAVEILNNYLLFRKNNFDSNNNYSDFALLSLLNEETETDEENQSEQENQTEDNQTEDNQTEDNQEQEEQNNNQTENDQNQETEIEEEILLPLLISKIYATEKDDFIELYNPNEVDIDLEEKSYRLYKTKTSASPYLMLRFGNLSDASYPGGLIVPAKDKYLITRSDASSKILNKAQAIVNRKEFTFTGNAYTVYLSDGVVSSDNDKDIVDKVGYGEATYYQVLPAKEILDNNILIRKAQADSSAIDMAVNCSHYPLGNSFNSYNNNFDFALLSLDDYYNNTVCIEGYEENEEIEENQDDEENQEDQENEDGEDNNNFSIYNYCLDSAIESDDILNLWHLDECQGANSYDFASSYNISGINALWLPSKFGCALSHHQDHGNISLNLDPNFSSNNFTLTFNYKLLYSNSRPTIRFINSTNSSYFSVQLYGHYTEFRNLPNVANRLEDLKWPMGDSWHQFTMVVNKDENYWALYNDGQEVLRKEMGLSFLADIDNILLIATGNHVIFDEFVIFKRAISNSDISAIYNYDLPFNHSNCSDRRFKEPELLAYFNSENNTFQEEDESIILFDSEYQQDLSLSLWLKKEAPVFNQFYLKLVGNSKNFFGLSLSDRFNYYFNNLELTAEEDIFTLMPNDNNWHHLILVYDSYKFELKIYIDGELKKSINKDWLTYDLIENLIISPQNSGVYLDEISLWSGVIDDFDANAMYLSKKSLFE